MQEKKVPGKNGFVYRQQWGIIIMCESEAHQARLFDKLKAQGYKLRVVSV